jgi:membrane protease YdiL (CAAX protease family)
LIGAVIVVPLMFLMTVLVEQWYQALNYHHESEHELLKTLGEVTSPRMKIILVASAVLLAPAFEEILFRGYVQTALLGSLWRIFTPPESVEPHPKRWQRWLAIIIASVAFAGVHPQFWMMPPIFFLSICLGYAYERTGNLWVTIVIHAMFNAASTALFLTTRA